MELEFDKEIDAILRKAGSTAAPPDAAGVHLDADGIAAFAEGALPQAVRTQYIGHLSDCMRCTRVLAAAVTTRPDDEPALLPVAAAAAADAPVPWYKAFFATRNLAVAMGSLAVLFVVMIGYVAFRQQSPDSSTVSQVTTADMPAAGSFSQPEPETQLSNSNTTSAMATNAAPRVAETSEANSAVSSDQPATGAGSTAAPKEESLSAKKVEDLPLTARGQADLKVEGAGTARQSANPMAASAPPPPPATAPRSAETDRAADSATAAEVKSAERSRSDGDRRLAAASPRAKMTGPASSGPMQNQANQQNTRTYEAPVTRTAGGKTFNNRENVWYDNSYSGQATANVRRSSDEFKKLDSGLRSIASSLGGTVVVVWKGKAYRIQ